MVILKILLFAGAWAGSPTQQQFINWNGLAWSRCQVQYAAPFDRLLKQQSPEQFLFRAAWLPHIKDSGLKPQEQKPFWSRLFASPNRFEIWIDEFNQLAELPPCTQPELNWGAYSARRLREDFGMFFDQKFYDRFPQGRPRHLFESLILAQTLAGHAAPQIAYDSCVADSLNYIAHSGDVPREQCLREFLRHRERAPFLFYVGERLAKSQKVSLAFKWYKGFQEVSATHSDAVWYRLAMAALDSHYFDDQVVLASYQVMKSTRENFRFFQSRLSGRLCRSFEAMKPSSIPVLAKRVFESPIAILNQIRDCQPIWIEKVVAQMQDLESLSRDQQTELWAMRVRLALRPDFDPAKARRLIQKLYRDTKNKARALAWWRTLRESIQHPSVDGLPKIKQALRISESAAPTNSARERARFWQKQLQKRIAKGIVDHQKLKLSQASASFELNLAWRVLPPVDRRDIFLPSFPIKYLESYKP